MASFAARPAVCADCGTHADPAVVTDLFRADAGIGTARSSGAALSDAVDGEQLCFSCYTARLGGPTHGAAVAVRDTDGRSERCWIVLAADGTDARDRLVRRVERSPIGDRVDGVECVALAAAYRDGPVARDGDGRPVLGRYAARELARGVGSESRHVYRGSAPRGSVIDVRSHVDDATRDAIGAEILDDAVAGGAHLRVGSRDDAGRVAADAYPTLAAHGALVGLGDRLWRHVRDEHPERLDERSRVASANQGRGRAFEEYFHELCDRSDLVVERPSDVALRERYPEKHGRLVDWFGERLTGVPDFFVAAPDGQAGLHEAAATDGSAGADRAAPDGGDVWRPPGDCFVEVKAGSSRLTREQERMIPYLKALGFPVYVLRGEPGDHRFDRR